jgi:simple sugar transport system permease protein
MSEIRSLRAGDVPAVAGLFQRVFRHSIAPPPASLVSYLQSHYLEAPGCDPEISPLVHVTDEGTITGFVGVNELMGVHHRIVLDFPAGYGFAGIAVALMGRNHPFGIAIAALLFGALQQGGAELAFEIPKITRETVVLIQGLVILFSGALANMPRAWFSNLLMVIPPLRSAAPEKS